MTKRKRTSDPRRQHWVPCFYLRYFATPESRDTEDPLVWALSKYAGEPFLTSVRQIGAQCFIYSPKDGSGKRQWDMEAKLTGLEGAMNSIWPMLANASVDLQGDEAIRKALALFVSILHLRHPKRLSEVETIHKQIVSMCEGFPKDEAGRPMIESVEHRGIVQPLDNSSWYDSKAAGPNEKSRMFVDGIRQNATAFAQILLKKRWYVVFSQQPVFITTDTPVAMVNPNRKVFGLATPGTEVLFPLSPTRVLIMDDRHDQPEGSYYPLLDDTRGSGPFNLTAWHHAERFMISPRHTHAVCAEMVAWSDGHAPGTNPSSSM